MPLMQVQKEVLYRIWFIIDETDVTGYAAEAPEQEKARIQPSDADSTIAKATTTTNSVRDLSSGTNLS